MELYEEYYEIFKKYRTADQKYDDVLEEKAKLFFDTQPKAIDTTKEIVSGGKTVDKFQSFVEQLEKLEPELNKARNERDLQNYLLKKKELEYDEYIKKLDTNNAELDNIAVDNIIYYYTFIKHLKIKHIAPKIHYSREWTYELLKKIREKLNNLQKLTDPV